MAAMTYRCPVDDDCPEQGHPGFCPNHPDARLERARPRPAAQPDPAQAAAEEVAAAEALRPPVPLIAVGYLGASLQIPPGGLTLGRDTTPSLGLPGQVGRKHAHLYWDGSVLRVRDLGSWNGTYVDGRKLDREEAAALKPGQALRLALDVELSVAEIEVDDYGRPL